MAVKLTWIGEILLSLCCSPSTMPSAGPRHLVQRAVVAHRQEDVELLQLLVDRGQARGGDLLHLRTTS